MWRALQFIGLFVGFLLHVSTIKFGSCNAATVGCIERERHALLKFKQGLNHSTNRLSSWVGEDCCGWRGVGCNNQTGNVIKLDLRNRYVDDYNSPDYGWALGGKINPSLVDLKHLNYLDLSLNYFGGISIPKFVGSFKKLRYLNFSNAGFGGTIPPQLGNLSRLQYLDLHNYFIPTKLYRIFADNLQWLSRLVSLQYLDMGGVNLEKATDWMKVINVLSSLSELHLRNCGLNSSSILPSLSSPNFTSLAVLDLSYNSFHGPPLSFGNMTSLVELHLSQNNFKGELPRTLGSLCKLQALDLTSNEFTGELLEFVESLSGCVRESLEVLSLSSNQLGGYLPDGLGMLKNLKFLDLYGNSFHGLIPTSLGRLTFLKLLDLGFNQLNGTVPESLGQLSELVYLYIDSNSLEGVISEGNFVNLSRLELMFMSSNSLVLNVSSKWVPPFQLTQLSMSSCTLGPQFPAWLQTQKDLNVRLDLSNTQIVGTMPNWFWNWSSQIYALYLSHNHINGKLPISFKFNGSIIDLSSNLFDGSLPLFSPNVILLDLSNNSFSGSIPSSIGEMMPELTYLSLSRNLINGSIPASVCKLWNLRILDLKENQLSGQLPQCWRDSPELLVMNLANNDLVGDIPSSIGYLFLLESLHLSNNSLSGELPLTLKICTRLVTLDLGENKLSGNIPIWIGESLSSLKILRLRSNMFDGDLPSQLSHLADLQVLDLAHNNLSGTIPRSFYNLTAMTTTQKELRPVLSNTASYQESVMVAMKGGEFEYKGILSLVTSTDLSCNSLSGEIPEELATLYGLLSLNLSENHLTGKIPEGISGLRWLETLDLSRNLLSGPIPSGMSALTFLNHLNLSYNNFSGKIPSGNQLQTLDDPSIYVGNPKLCGSPLKVKCPGEETSQDLVPSGSASGSAIEDDEEDGDVSETLSFCLAIGLGFSAGFSAFWGVLLLKKSWRYAYFQFFDDMKDRFFFKTVAPKPTRIQNKKFGRNRGSS